MNYRLNKKALYGVIVLVLLVVGLFGYTLISAPTSEAPEKTDDTPVGTNVEQRTISAQHQYRDGVHTIAGTVTVPSPCHRLLAEPFFIDESKERVEIRFTTSVEGEVCAQVVTDARFKVTFEAPEQATVSATWNGAAATLNLVPVAPGTNLDDFELYLKG